MNLDNIFVNTQSSIRIDNKKVLYFDPWKIEKESKDADFIFITHNHFDHFSPEDINTIIKDDTIIVCPESMKKTILDNKFTDESKILFLMPGIVKEKNGILIETVASYNKLKPFHPKKSGFLGYVVTIDGERIYVPGDTDLTEELMNVNCNLAFLPIGGTYTMDVKEAAKAVRYIGADYIIPIHYGSVENTAEPSVVNDFIEMVPTNAKVVCKLFVD